MSNKTRRVKPISDPSLAPYQLPDGRPLELFAMLAHSPVALADMKGATARALEATALPVRLRELIILRILARFGAAAEWDVHVALYGDALNTDDLAQLGADGNDFGSLDEVIVDFADALCAGGAVDDALWNQLETQLGTELAIEALFVGAQYIKVAIMVNALGVRPPIHADAGT